MLTRPIFSLRGAALSKRKGRDFSRKLRKLCWQRNDLTKKGKGGGGVGMEFSRKNWINNYFDLLESLLFSKFLRRNSKFRRESLLAWGILNLRGGNPATPAPSALNMIVAMHDQRFPIVMFRKMPQVDASTMCSVAVAN